MKKLFKALPFFLLAGCPVAGPAEPPLNPIQPMDTDKCEEGCMKLHELGCAEASGSNHEDPNSCANDCRYVQTNGLHIRPSCWITMTNCSQLDTMCK